jgi:hypothetical protein
VILDKSFVFLDPLVAGSSGPGDEKVAVLIPDQKVAWSR